MAHHVGLDVDGVDLGLGQHVREAHAEVAGAGADVGDDRVGLERERLDHLVRLLPFVAFRVVEDARPALGVVEVVLVLGDGLRRGRRRNEEQRDDNWC